MKNSFITPTAPLKAVEEVCVTCGSNHSYNNCPLTRGGNDFPVFYDNIQQFQTAAVGPIEVTTDTKFPSPEDIQPPLVQVEVQVDKPAEEPSVVIPKAKANLPYPSRLQKEKLRENDDILAAKFMEIFRDLHFKLSFADALVHMPKFTPMFKKLLNNKDKLIEPFIPIHILEEERTRRELADYINRMEMLFTINSRPHNPTNDNTNVESFYSFPIPNQESEPHQEEIDEEIDVIFVTNDVLPPSDDDSDEEVDVVGDLRVDNFIQNSEHEYSESEDSDFDIPPLPLPPPEPPDKEFDFKKEISVVRNVIVKFECIDARVKFNVFNDENDIFMFIMFAKKFSLLSAESEDTIFDPDAKARLLRWILLIHEFDFKVIDTKGAENYVADHLSRLENPYENVFDPKEINETFPLESLNKVAHQV
nr:reverse transcriptase domain-containing protein [Tanacetum cinerariifolium]